MLFFSNTQMIRNFFDHTANESIRYSEVPWIFLWTLSNLKWRIQSKSSLTINEKPYPENHSVEKRQTDNNFRWFTKQKPFQMALSNLVWK